MCRAALESEGNSVQAGGEWLVYLMAVPYVLVVELVMLCTMRKITKQTKAGQS
jgi:hypothetical protein